MMKRIALLLVTLTSFAAADRGSELAINSAMREYYGILRGTVGISRMQSIRNRIVNHVKGVKPKTRASVVRQLNKGFDSKAVSGTDFHLQLAEALAGCGKTGIAMLKKRIKASSKRLTLRRLCTEALGSCGNQLALKVLLGVIHDKDADVAAAAVKGCASYAKSKAKTRKESMKKLVARYTKVTADAAGKARDSDQRRLYDALKPAMNETLKAFSGGESLDSAEAWDAWLRENITKPWPDK